MGDAPSYSARSMAENEPLTDEQIIAGTIGERKRHDAPVTLVAYDPAWPVLYRREEQRIRRALGDRVLLLEHVGSTSVPGLSAKPMIDIVMAVDDSADEPAYVPALEAVGYVLRIREPDWHQHRLLKGPDHPTNLHVYSVACPEVGRLLLFRDRLRTVPAERELASSTSAPSASSRSVCGSTSRTTPTPRRMSWKRSSSAPAPPGADRDIAFSDA